MIKLIFLAVCLFTEGNILKGAPMKYNPLTPDEEKVMIYKGTEKPFSGKFVNNFKAGLYTCKRCNAILYRAGDKFESHCGWPSFDDAVPDAVRKIPDADGKRTEILCKNCGAHLGHVFTGEEYTKKNIRYCVNSISMNFIPISKLSSVTKKCYFAGGCFWGTQYFFQKAKGVVFTYAGYMGGTLENPTYEEVSSGATGYKETVEVIYDPLRTSFKELAKLFFDIHDPTQKNGQGPDIGDQYKSCIFYINEDQKKIADELIKELSNKGYKVATHLEKAGKFSKAEEYHQNYYLKNKKTPYCHRFVDRI